VRAVCGDRAGHAEIEVKMTLTWDKNEIGKERFAPCACLVLLLKISREITVRTVVQKMLSIQFGVWKSGEFCRNIFSPVPLNKFNLTRCGIFRGQISQRKNQNQK
jgi:hypothetical protein